MILSTLFDHINNAYRGSDDDAPVAGTADYDLWLNTTNRKISEWAKDSKNVWKSLWAIENVGTVVAGTQNYNLSATLLQGSDRVIITTTGGDDVEYRLVEPQERGRYANSCYISGANPQVLSFFDDIVAGADIVGGTIFLPGYFAPVDLDAAADTIPVDDPYWLVLAVASELAFNDLTYESKAGDLNAKANSLYQQMATMNRRGTNNNPRVARTNVNRIPGTHGVV